MCRRGSKGDDDIDDDEDSDVEADAVPNTCEPVEAEEAELVTEVDVTGVEVSVAEAANRRPSGTRPVEADIPEDDAAATGNEDDDGCWLLSEDTQDAPVLAPKTEATP